MPTYDIIPLGYKLNYEPKPSRAITFRSGFSIFFPSAFCSKMKISSLRTSIIIDRLRFCFDMCTEDKPCYKSTCSTFELIDLAVKGIKSYPTRQSGIYEEIMKRLIQAKKLRVINGNVYPNLSTRKSIGYD